MYDALLDGDDVFQGTPQSKFYDIVYNANSNLVENELSRIIERQAALEAMLIEQIGEEDFDNKVKTYQFNNASALDNEVRSLYIESVGNILSQNE